MATTPMNIAVDPTTQHPRVDVPSERLWSLVEYMSSQRAAVAYEYHSDHFTVHFQRANAAAAQQLLTDWMAHEHAQTVSAV